MSRIVLAMSGGVDSSVAAFLLREAGHEVIGVFMRHGEEALEACKTDKSPGFSLPIFNPRADHKQGCCSSSDAEDARRVADRLQIPFYALNLKAEFKQIIDYFVDEYTRGRTPNPCVQCNNWLKFGKLFDYADSVGAQFVATGHYARMVATEQGPAISRGVDDGKDQSYVLFGIERKLLPRMLLPIGDFKKPKIRELAAEIGLRVADKRDSQEICFVTSGHHGDFVRERREQQGTSGEIVTTAGKVVGTHPGIEGFTIGQRKGLGIEAPAADGRPRYVTDIDPESATVRVGSEEHLQVWSIRASRAVWTSGQTPDGPFECIVQVRAHGGMAPALATPIDDADGPGIEISLAEPLTGVARGQAAVLYLPDAQRGDLVLGSGRISVTSSTRPADTHSVPAR